MIPRAVQKQAFDYFVSMGWTQPQSAGIVANLWTESSLNPAAVGDGGAAYGIAQWHGDRQAGFAALMGKPIQGSSLEDQLAWVHAELQRGEKAAGDTLRGCSTAAAAGECVSKLYERPADAENEATRRGALAETILQACGGAVGTQPQPEPAPTPPGPIQGPSQPSMPQPGVPMGAIATFLPLILQLIPALTGIKGLGAVVGAVSGAGSPVPLGPAPTGGSLHAGDYIALAQTILQTFINAIPAANGNPALAVGLAQTDPAVAATATQAVMAHPDVVAQLNAQIPVFDKIAGYDKATNEAAIAGRAAAAAVAQHDTYDVAPLMVKNVTNTTSWMIGGVIIGIIVAMLAKALLPDTPDWVGSLIPVLTFIAGQFMKERGAIIAYRFDGTPASNATAAVNQQIATMNATKP